MNSWQKKIRVDKKITPLHFNKRQTVDLRIGEQYFVSFGLSEVTPCTLIGIEKREGGKGAVTIEIPVKAKSKKGFIDLNGNISHHWVDTHTLYEDEIGTTPEQAVLYTVTF